MAAASLCLQLASFTSCFSISDAVEFQEVGGASTTATVYAEPWHARNRLAELGLDEELLLEAVQVGFSARVSCTPHHPPGAPGYFGLAETVRTLRDRLTPKGWTPINESNLPLVISQERGVALAVSTGSKATGVKEGAPRTGSTKGPMTDRAVLVNQLELFADTGIIIDFERQRRLFSESEMMTGEPSENTLQLETRTTWILLVYCDIEAQKVRCELSCPIRMNDDGYVDEWKERIILTATPFDGIDPSRITEPKGPSSPEIRVEIKKRA